MFLSFSTLKSISKIIIIPLSARINNAVFSINALVLVILILCHDQWNFSCNKVVGSEKEQHMKHKLKRTASYYSMTIIQQKCV